MEKQNDIYTQIKDDMYSHNNLHKTVKLNSCFRETKATLLSFKWKNYINLNIRYLGKLKP